MLRNFGVTRRRAESLEKVIIVGKVAGKGSRGRPKMRYSDTIKRAAGTTSKWEATRLAQNRDGMANACLRGLINWTSVTTTIR